MYAEFTTVAYDKRVMKNECVAVHAHDSGTANGVTMEISITSHWIYITKEQAMKFFGLVDPNTAPLYPDPYSQLSKQGPR